MNFFGPGTTPRDPNYRWKYTPEKVEQLYNKKWKNDFPELEFDFTGPIPMVRCGTCASVGRNERLGGWTPVDLNKPVRQFKRHFGLSGDGDITGSYHATSVNCLAAQSSFRIQRDENVDRWQQFMVNAEKQKSKAERDMERKAITLLKILEFVVENDFSIAAFNDLRAHLGDMIQFLNENHLPEAELTLLLEDIDAVRDQIMELARKYKIAEVRSIFNSLFKISTLVCILRRIWTRSHKMLSKFLAV